MVSKGAGDLESRLDTGEHVIDQWKLDSSDVIDYLTKLREVTANIFDVLQANGVMLDTPALQHMEYFIWETGVNAGEHGNHHEPGSTVLVELLYKSNRYAVRISDQGKGYDPRFVVAPAEANEAPLSEFDDAGYYPEDAKDAQKDWLAANTEERGRGVFFYKDVPELRDIRQDSVASAGYNCSILIEFDI